ncbi:hypothetical protein NQ318_020237 [Aromia moschata]|uniref:T-box domain-containing protein n=1 Tax=Aromia moschata TaxID=1265417 RepID=A0AAV8Z9F0_9CUCU|nr:hypothetical protein NQ318_020237 [Aromia moschata]
MEATIEGITLSPFAFIFVLIGASTLNSNPSYATDLVHGREYRSQSIVLRQKFVETSASSVPSTPEPVGLDCTVVSADNESGRDSPVDVSSTSESGVPSQSHSSDRRSPTRNPLLQERCTSEDLRNVTCHLETKDLWDKFNELGTEMIITKTGREACAFSKTWCVDGCIEKTLTVLEIYEVCKLSNETGNKD